jgi:hypothetical protein
MEEIKEIFNHFESFSLGHVCKERNQEANFLSKARVHMTSDQWHIKKIKGGTVFEYYHPPFHDPPPTVTLKNV